MNTAQSLHPQVTPSQIVPKGRETLRSNSLSGK
jgi:hypothetical protein